MRKDTYKFINNQPYGEKPRTLAEHAINCLTICMDISWKEAYQVLLVQSQILGFMPNHVECAYGMIQALGFTKVDQVQGLMKTDICEYMRRTYHSGEVAVVQTTPVGNAYGYMMAVVPVDSNSLHYECRGAAPFYSDYSDATIVWVGKKNKIEEALEDCRKQQEEGYRRDDPHNRRVTLSEKKDNNSAGSNKAETVNLCRHTDHEYFHYFQPNPLKRNIGDCVIRAFSAVFNVSWEEAMARLGDAVGYGESTVNGNSLFINLLIREGYGRHAPIKRNNRLLTGKQFCEMMNVTCLHEERIFAFVGNNHVAAVLPYRDTQGHVHYRITDSWDSSNRKIGEYWVKIPEAEEPGKKGEGMDEALTVFSAGDSVNHPRFGRGMIKNIMEKNQDQILEIDFGTAGIKKLAGSWVKKNCKYREK